MKVQSYRELHAWQKGIALAKLAYEITSKFPGNELYGLTAQIRRAAISIPSNIAEGQGRATRGEFKHFLCIARGSLFELQTQVLLARELGYLATKDEAEVQDLIMASAMVLNGLIRSLA